jgi:hypothetical protein
MLSKSLLEWSERAPARAASDREHAIVSAEKRPSASAEKHPSASAQKHPIASVEKYHDPMNAQARASSDDSDTFEALWRDRIGKP